MGIGWTVQVLTGFLVVVDKSGGKILGLILMSAATMLHEIWHGTPKAKPLKPDVIAIACRRSVGPQQHTDSTRVMGPMLFHSNRLVHQLCSPTTEE